MCALRMCVHDFGGQIKKKIVNMIEPSVLCSLGGGRKPLAISHCVENTRAHAHLPKNCDFVSVCMQTYIIIWWRLWWWWGMYYVIIIIIIYGNLYTIHTHTRVCLLFHVYIVNSNYVVCVNKLHIQYKRFIYYTRVHMQCGAAAGKQTPTHLST